MIIGITGPIGHGKTTLANALETIEPSTKHFESSTLISHVIDRLHQELADKPTPSSIDSINDWLATLPDILEDIVHVRPEFSAIKVTKDEVFASPVEYDKLFAHLVSLKNNPGLAKQEITAQNKFEYRPFLQWIGGYLIARVSKGIWYDELIRQAQTAMAEGTKLCVMGGVRYPAEVDIIHAAKGTVIKIVRPDLKEIDITDPTERERNNIQPDTTVINDGSLEELQECAERILSDMKRMKLKPTYHSRVS